MCVDVPVQMSDDEVKDVIARIDVIDRLIGTEEQKIKDLLEEGLKLEGKLKKEYPNYTT